MKHEDGSMTNNPPAQIPPDSETGRGAHVARYILIGFFTVALLWVTWLVFASLRKPPVFKEADAP